MQAKDRIVVGLDIGTTKICVMVSRKDEEGNLEILGKGQAKSTGVKRGAVENIDKTAKAIRIAVTQAEAQSQIKIDKVYVGIAGEHINSYQHHGSYTRKNIETEISQADIDALMDDMYNLSLNAGERFIHILPQEYYIDYPKHITKEPIGYNGNRITADFHVITGNGDAIRNIERSVQKAGLTVAGIILEPIASAAAVLTDEELEAGVVLVDIGGGTTDVAIFHEGIIRHTAVIPFGGNAITEDISEGCATMFKYAEEVKLSAGGAFSPAAPENEIITIPGLRGRAPKEIGKQMLWKIIEARVEEILEQVTIEIGHSGLHDKLLGGVVLTGGGSCLRKITTVSEMTTALDSRIGIPNEHLDMSNRKKPLSPIYATTIGLLLKGFEDKVDITPESLKENAIEQERLNVERALLDGANETEEAINSDVPKTAAAGRAQSINKFFKQTSNKLYRWMMDDDEGPADFN